MKRNIARLTVTLSILTLISNAQNLWQEMPNGKDFFDMRCIYQDSSTGILYAGGTLWSQIIGGDTVYCITYWDGSKWAEMENGVTSHGNMVTSILNYQGTIYASGVFSVVDGCPGTSIMKWDGSQWGPVGYGQCEGTNKVINCCGGGGALFEIDGLLYFTGVYDTVGCMLGNGMATWDGVDWHTVYDFPNTHPENNPRVIAICTLNDQLYVTGQFYSVDGALGNEIAFYDGTQWHTVGGGLFGSLTVPFDMVTYKNQMYVAGRFKKSEGNPGNNIASWDGYQWSDLEGGTNGQVFDLLKYHDKLYVFGDFTEAGGIPAKYIAIWDGSKWCGINSNFIKPGIGCSGIYNDTILIGGGFKILQGNDTIVNFAKFLAGDYVDTCGAAVGISEINKTNFDFSLSPNPATTQLQIYFPSTNQPQHVTLINTLGQTIQQQTFSTNQLKLDISTLPSGVYFIALQNEKGRAVKKFVKE